MKTPIAGAPVWILMVAALATIASCARTDQDASPVQFQATVDASVRATVEQTVIDQAVKATLTAIAVPTPSPTSDSSEANAVGPVSVEADTLFNYRYGYLIESTWEADFDQEDPSLVTLTGEEGHFVTIRAYQTSENAAAFVSTLLMEPLTRLHGDLTSRAGYTFTDGTSGTELLFQKRRVLLASQQGLVFAISHDFPDETAAQRSVADSFSLIARQGTLPPPTPTITPQPLIAHRQISAGFSLKIPADWEWVVGDANTFIYCPPNRRFVCGSSFSRILGSVEVRLNEGVDSWDDGQVREFVDALTLGWYEERFPYFSVSTREGPFQTACPVEFSHVARLNARDADETVRDGLVYAAKKSGRLAIFRADFTTLYWNPDEIDQILESFCFE